jgi:signal transduction histidine kinase
LFRESAEYASEYRLIHKDGTHIPVEVSSRVIEYESEPALLATMRDLTERRQLEDRLRQSQKMEAVGQLAGGIAHDFNNLLTVIQTSSELIADSLPARVPELAADVAEVRGAVKRGKSLVEQLLAFSRRGELQFNPVDLGRLALDFKPTLQRLLPDDVEIRIEVTAEECVTHGNPGSLEQIMMNLATNASYAMPSGGVLSLRVHRVRVTMEDSVEHGAVSAGEFVCLTVSDNGVGMDEWTRDKLFEPFFTTRSMGGGTGLGTAVVYGLVKQHGGTVRVDSEVGKGTTVEVYLPVFTEGAEPTEEEVPQELRPEKYGGSETILVAEDEPALRRAAKRCLERLGYRVLVAADGQEAVQLYRDSAGPVHLVMTDIIMPKMGGRALYETLQSDDGAVKFLFASGYTAGDMQEKDQMEPDFPFIAKPWTIDELAQKVREVLDQK